MWMTPADITITTPDKTLLDALTEWINSQVLGIALGVVLGIMLRTLWDRFKSRR